MIKQIFQQIFQHEEHVVHFKDDVSPENVFQGPSVLRDLRDKHRSWPRQSLHSTFLRTGAGINSPACGILQ